MNKEPASGEEVWFPVLHPWVANHMHKIVTSDQEWEERNESPSRTTSGSSWAFNEGWWLYDMTYDFLMRREEKFSRAFRIQQTTLVV